jgi:hypothetical protein
MKAPTSVFAALLTLSCASLGQTPTPSPAPTASTASTEAAAASAAPFAAGAKLFFEPMGGFGQFLADAIVKKKVPVVVVKERAKADFVVSGDAHVKNRGFFTSFVRTTGGKGSVSIKDARTGGQVFGCRFNKVDQMEADVYIYQSWAEGCAKHMKKALEKKK